MTPEGTTPGRSDPRVIEIDTQRVLGRVQAHCAVIDIGSNSIRLVVYDDFSRAPFPRFNEKSFCTLGASIDAAGNLSGDAIRRTVHALRRFHAIATAMGVTRLDVIATEATRRAANGHALVDAIREATGLETRILTGIEEATYAAHGVISGFFQPKGMIGDLGGGSLEVAEVVGDRVGERMTSMPIGTLPVKAKMDQGLEVAKDWLDGILAQSLPPLLTEPAFYAIGGGWRALARVQIATANMPIRTVHGLSLPAEAARKLAKRIALMPPEAVAQLPDAPDRRIATLPAAAFVMWRLLKVLQPERVVFSAIGLREGWLYAHLDQVERYRDPLLEAAMSIGLPHARVSDFPRALADWTDGLFPGETQEDRRLRLTVCALTDIAWRDHEKVRGWDAFQRLLQFPFIGISHPERAFIATAIFARYGGTIDATVKAAVGRLLGPSGLRRAEVLGRTLLLAHRFSASVPEILSHGRVRIDTDAVRLVVTNPESVPDSDAVQARLKQLARAAGVEAADIVTPAG